MLTTHTATISLFVTDLDHTLVGDDQALERLNELLMQHRRNYNAKVVYSTGRSLTLYRQLQGEKQLLEPDALVTSVGTEIRYPNSDALDLSWSEKLQEGWSRELVVSTIPHFAELVPQKESEQRPFKVSYLIDGESAVKILPQIDILLKRQGLATKLIYSGSRDLDIIPSCADKGLATEFLQQKWGIDSTQTVVCGDSGNDMTLFLVPGAKGIVVGNAKPELLKWHESFPSPNRYLADARCAGGIIEGLRHFGFIQ